MSLRDSPAEIIDSLELARSALACLSYQTGQSGREVHITSLQHIFAFAKCEMQLGDTLNTIEALREVQNLGNGYWLPAPTRTVELWNGLHLCLSAVPTHELKRHIPDIKRAGAGRISQLTHSDSSPRQSMASWLTEDSKSVGDWTTECIALAEKQFSPSINVDAISGFALKGRYAGAGLAAVWSPIEDRDVVWWQGVALMRRRIGQRHFQYFLGKRSLNHPFLEGPVVADYLRMQYGLADAIGRRLPIVVRELNNAVNIQFPIRVPPKPRRLLIALAEEDLSSFGHRWFFRNLDCKPAIDFLSNSLGCEVQR